MSNVSPNYEHALQNSSKKYHGRQCRNGHGTLRYTKTKGCVECAAINRNRWKENNPERMLKVQLDWYNNNKEYVSERNKSKRLTDPDKYRKRGREYYENNKDRMRQLGREHYYRHSDRIRENQKQRYEGYVAFRKNGKPVAIEKALRRAREFGRAIELDEYGVQQLMELRGKGCSYCGSDEKLHLDHKTPVSRGGNHTLENLQWLCQFHNLSKGFKSHEQYVIWCAEIGRELPMLENESENRIPDSKKAEGGLSDLSPLNRYLASLFA